MNKLRTTENNGLVFWCPGCDMAHRIQYGHGDRPRWTWNNDSVNPTINPSILVRWEQWEPPATTPEIREAIKEGKIVQTCVKKVCHSFIKNGKIEYLNDCTHQLAGKTVDLSDWNDNY